MTLLALPVLAGMAFYVYNTGVQVNDRLAMQDAADSAAISGSVWMARSMNGVAMNNVAMAKLLASVVVLDSVPLATNMSLAEVTGWQAAMQAQLLSMPTINLKIPDAGEKAILAAALPVLNNRMTTEINILTPVDTVLNNSGFNMALTTNWSIMPQQGGQAQQGTLWQAILALQQFSAATKASCGSLAQANAVRYGQSDKAAVAFEVPVLAVMPAIPGTFGDFEWLLRGSEGVQSNTANANPRGGPGGAIPDMVYPYRLGPYARLLRWRNPWTRTIGATAIPPSGNASGIPGDGGVGSQGPGFGGGSTGGTTLTFGYSTYGPVAWAMNNLGWWTNGNGTSAQFGQLPDTHFRQYMSQLTGIKLEYMFGSQATKQIHKPVIISDYGAAKQAAANPKTPPYMTYYFCVRIISSVPEGGNQWLQPDTCWTNVPGFGYDQSVTPVFTGFGGWLDMDTLVGGANPNPQPGRPAPAVWTRLGNYVWKETATGTSTSFPQIGIIQKLDGQGNPIPQPLYFVEFRIFGGLDVGPMVDVSDPCNGLESTIAAQVLPLKLDVSQGDCADPNAPGLELGADQGARRTKFTFLGVAQHGASSSFWPNQFPPANPSGNMVAVAQAELFNNSSWDLWTQDWRAQMVPVSQWDDWTAQMDAGAGDASATNGLLQPNEVTDVSTYLKRLNSQMTQAYINH